MRATNELLEKYAARGQSGLYRASIIDILSTGEILVRIPEMQSVRILCDFLQTGDNSSLKLAQGDRVLVMPPVNLENKGCVLGRIGAYEKPNTETVVIKAERELRLECGESAITLRHDGKVLNKAVDITSHAKRRNRIKGGSVQIN